MYSEILEEEKKPVNSQENIVRFNKSKTLNLPWLEQYLPYEYRGIRMPDFISVSRDRAIIACFFHILSSITGGLFYIMRRVKYFDKFKGFKKR